MTSSISCSSFTSARFAHFKPLRAINIFLPVESSIRPVIVAYSEFKCVIRQNRINQPIRSLAILTNRLDLLYGFLGYAVFIIKSCSVVGVSLTTQSVINGETFNKDMSKKQLAVKIEARDIIQMLILIAKYIFKLVVTYPSSPFIWLISIRNIPRGIMSDDNESLIFKRLYWIKRILSVYNNLGYQLARLISVVKLEMKTKLAVTYLRLLNNIVSTGKSIKLISVHSI